MRRRLPSIPVSLWCITCLILHGLTPNKDDTLAFTEIRNRAKHHVRATSRKKVYSHQNFGWAIFRSSAEENVWECSSFGSKTRLSHSCSMKTHIVGHQIEHNSYLQNCRHWKLSLYCEIVSFVWMVRCRETAAKVRWWVICIFIINTALLHRNWSLCAGAGQTNKIFRCFFTEIQCQNKTFGFT